MTPTKAEELAARAETLAIAEALERRFGCSALVLTADIERAAAELRRLSAENTAAVSSFLAADDERRELRAERDALLETFAKVCTRLDIDTEAARKQPGKPSDVLIGAIDAEQEALKVALECERMRVVACGVVACSDTPKSAAVARDMLPVYRSASCDDVARRVDECISLRAERDALHADSERWRSLYARAINEANGLTNYVEDRPELRRAEKQLEAIQREARAIDAAMKGTT